MVTRPHIAASGLKLRADSRKTRLPCRSPFQARTRPKSATIASLEHELLVALGGREDPDLLGGRGDRDVAVGVVLPGQAALGDLGADAGGGEEGRDARAAGPHPLGQRALRGQLDLELAGEVLPRELLVLADVRRDHPAHPLRPSAARPRPQSSTPQLLETPRGRSRPASSSASMSTDGMPHSPNPPTASVAPRAMSATASAALRPPCPRARSLCRPLRGLRRPLGPVTARRSPVILATHAGADGRPGWP